jgi:upstream activation factor subunit UAF30
MPSSKTSGSKSSPKAADKAEPKTVKAKTASKIKPPAGGNKPNALQQPMKPSPELAAIVGDGPLSRGDVVSKMWEYIKASELQNPENKREILADDKLKKVFGKDKVTMFEMNKHLARHLQ